MDKTISAADANRRFSEVLRRVRRGDSVVVTSHGRPVARIAPVDLDSAASRAARTLLLARLREQPIVEAGSWSRDELYEH